MFSSHWTPCAILVLKAATLIVGLATAAISARAAYLWYCASKVKIADSTPRVEVSYSDYPDLGALEAKVSANATQIAYNASAALNASAAGWTAAAAALAAITAVLGAI
jgi:hypothetical protein